MLMTAVRLLTETVDVDEAASELVNAGINQIISYAYAPFCIVIAYFSGQFWLYIISSYLPKKRKKLFKELMNNYIGRILLGAMWEALVLLLIYGIRYRSFFNIELNAIEACMPTVLVATLALQAFIIVFITFLHRKGQKNGNSH